LFTVADAAAVVVVVGSVLIVRFCAEIVGIDSSVSVIKLVAVVEVAVAGEVVVATFMASKIT